MVDLLKIIEEQLPSGRSMSMATLRNKLFEEFGDGVVFATMRKKPTVACFRGSAHKIVNSWYTNRLSDEKEERMRIVETAATIVREDIRTTAYDTSEYPKIMNFLDNTESMVPETLKVLLQTIILADKKGTKDTLLKKCSAISHSVIAATRPRSFISPLQLGLAIYLFRKVGSKNIVDAVSNMGFCSSYRDVSLFEASAVQSWNPLIDKGAFSQFSFDNADFNIKTMTGKETFHSMGGIRCFTPYTSVNDTNVPRLTVVPASTDIASTRRIQMQTFQRQSEGGLAKEPLKNVYQEVDFEKATEWSNHDIAWILGKFLHQPCFPGWQGFMSEITSALPYVKSRVLALPFVNHPPTQLSTILTVLIYAAEESKKSGQSTCIVTFDQPLYMKAKDIVLQNNSEHGELSNVIVRLGGFHLLMSFLGSIGFLMTGSGLAELWSTVYASASIPHMLSGHAYARAIRAHYLTFCAISMLIVEEIEVTQDDKDYIQSLLAGIENNTLTFDMLVNNETLTKIRIKFSEAINRLRENGKTAKLWLQYLELVTIVIHFIQAERTGNWELHLRCIRAMLPVFHATGHFPYAKACQIYLQDMDCLNQKMSEKEYEQFTQQGFFTIRRSEKHWSGIWSDMTIEQTLMRGMKSLGGLTHGRGFTESVLSKWILGMPSTHHVCEAVEIYCNITPAISDQHVEMRDSRIQTDEQDCRKFEQWLRNHSPFTITNNLISLSTGIVAEEKTNCYDAKTVGEKILNATVGNEFGTVKLKRANIVRNMASSSGKLKVGNDIIQVDSTQLFQRIICTVHSPEDLRSCFKHELASVPLSLFDNTGMMRKTKKSSFYDIFNATEERQICIENYYVVLDGGFLIHRMEWPKEGTFLDVYTAYTNFIRKRYGQKVTVVFDGYSENSTSTKCVERERRLLKHSSREIVFDSNTLLVEQKNKFLGNIKNKERLISQLAIHLNSENISTSFAIDDADVQIIRTAIKLSEKNEQVLVVGQDVDLVVLLAALSPDDKDIIFLKEAIGNVKQRMYSSRDLQSSSIIRNLKKSILFIHAISGCDTSGFFGKGKQQHVQTFNREKDLDSIVDVFNNPKSTPEEIEKAGETFVLELYKLQSSEGSLSEQRYACFNKLVGQANSTVLLSKLPPTSAAARQHSRRTYLQVQIWHEQPIKPHQWGWKKINNTLSPIYTTESPAPASIVSLITCNCKQGCVKRCSCIKAGMKCTTMCGTCRGQSCTNTELIVETIDEDM